MPPIKHYPFPPSKPHYAGLTIKQQNFVTEAVRQIKEEGELNTSKAMQVAYPNDRNPRVTGSQALTNPNIKTAMQYELEKAGITDELISYKMREGMDAEKLEGTEKVADYNTRLKYIQEANKIKDVYPDQTINVDRRTANINIDLKADPEKLNTELQERLAEIRELQDEYK